MERGRLLAVALAIVLATCGCAPGPNDLAGTPDEEGSIAGFWLGLWHGFTALFTFLVSLFRENVRMYEVRNCGDLYDLGYLIGVVAFFGGGGRAGKRRRRMQ